MFLYGILSMFTLETLKHARVVIMQSVNSVYNHGPTNSIGVLLQTVLVIHKPIQRKFFNLRMPSNLWAGAPSYARWMIYSQTAIVFFFRFHWGLLFCWGMDCKTLINPAYNSDQKCLVQNNPTVFSSIRTRSTNLYIWRVPPVIVSCLADV